MSRMAEGVWGAPPGGAPRWIACLLALGACVVGWGLRWFAAQTDPWLDEIWTFELLRQILFPSDVLFELHHSNNHPLNTLILYWLGDGGDAYWWYRLHTLVSGVAMIAVAVFIAARRGVAEATFAAVLFATSFLLIHHASQARGYALMLLGLFVAFAALQRHHDRPSRVSGVVYAAGLAWAVLANLYALYAILAFVLWSAVVAIDRAGGVRAAIVPWCALHTIPGCVTVFVLGTFYLPGLVGRQFATDHWGIVAQSASLLLGGPFVGARAVQLLWVAAGLWLGGVFVLRRDRDREWLWYVLIVAVAPAIVLGVTQPRALYTRFFAASGAFLLLLISLLAGAMWRTGGLGRWVATAGVALIVWGNWLHVDRLLVAGRGQYSAAARYMARQTVATDISVGSDHVFGTAIVLRFFDPLIPEARFFFIPEEAPTSAPDWLVRVGHPRPSEVVYAGHLYDRDRSFPSGGFGFDWQLYRRVPMVDAVRRKAGSAGE